MSEGVYHLLSAVHSHPFILPSLPPCTSLRLASKREESRVNRRGGHRASLWLGLHHLALALQQAADQGSRVGREGGRGGREGGVATSHFSPRSGRHFSVLFSGAHQIQPNLSHALPPSLPPSSGTRTRPTLPSWCLWVWPCPSRPSPSSLAF